MKNYAIAAAVHVLGLTQVYAAEPVHEPVPAQMVESLARSEKAVADLAATIAKMEEKVLLIVDKAKAQAAPPPAPQLARKSVDATPIDGLSLSRFLVGILIGCLLGGILPQVLGKYRTRTRVKPATMPACSLDSTPSQAAVDLDQELAAPRIMQTEEADIINVAEVYASIGRPETAIQLLQVEVRDSPNNHEARRLLRRLQKQQAEASLNANPST